MTLSEIAALIEVEHRSKDVPVVVGKVVADVTQTGEELDEICAEILSFAALYRLPKEITLQLLQSPVSRHPRSRGRSSSRSLSSPSSSSSLPATSTTVMDDDDENEDSSSLIECQLAFAIGGWDVVSFPMGLAIRPKTKYRFGRPTSYEIRKEGGTFRSPLSWMHRTKTLRAAAAAAVTAAASVQPPRRLLDRREFLQSVNAQWQQLDNDDDGYDNRKVEDVPLLASAQAATRGPLYFPNTDRNIFTLWRTLRRVVSKKYTALKKKGRAGFLSYCFFNLVYYTVGILWQWPRMVAGDPLTSNLSIPTLVLRKFGKVFAYLYAVSQLFKLPKLFTAVALAPIAARTLQTLRQKFQIRNETIATAILVGFMFVIWGTVTAIPVLSEYSSLQRILYLDEQLVQVYGFQPV